ncbi:hypothetical protein [Wolbachia endosymbiont of Folsomia candida]|uniref:hypothetical protein n=1 Tax=Wolbachia endosymbiont of Folsomia candida TaxID=169402 RepID=UPI000A599C17|nr:hypothetical protein [Wolbachia endosymbiont of Folsomia candida]APR98018.1 hypothetical protein ASM33_01705 [Wolbachia endosymbiont of Folsomia candida]
MVGDNFQQKMAEILAWFEKNILGAGGPERRGLEIAKSAMLQLNYVIESSMNDRPDIQQSLFQENNKALEEPLSQLSEHTIKQVKERNRQPGSSK